MECSEAVNIEMNILRNNKIQNDNSEKQYNLKFKETIQLEIVILRIHTSLIWEF